jgi:hypothetical protein
MTKMYRIVAEGVEGGTQTLTHADSPGGQDYTLCGLSLEADEDAGIFLVTEMPKYTDPKIDCPQCRAIFDYCRMYLHPKNFR